MKNFCMSLALFAAIHLGYTQFVTCETMPLTLGNVFTFHNSAPFGDSAISFTLTNNSGTDFAYPLAKLDPLTPLPPGMSLDAFSVGWTVFITSWSHDSTAAVNIYYDINQPIAPNYTVDFLLYVSNFSPLSIDSCVFTDTIRINLNPSGTAGIQELPNASLKVYPNPTHDFVWIDTENTQTDGWIDMYTPAGNLIRSMQLQPNTPLDVRECPPGIYILKQRNQASAIRLVVGN
jgi:hypothetical protein